MYIKNNGSLEEELPQGFISAQNPKLNLTFLTLT